MNDISSAEPAKSTITVNGLAMAHVDEGDGPPVVFLHGNPTSSYLWRNIWPHVTGSHRALAPDLIGMGDSAKLPTPGSQSYRFAEHRDYLNGWMDALVPDGPVVLVVHDWGSALGLDWARRNAGRVAGVCFMEGMFAPFTDWDDFNAEAKGVFQGFRSDKGEEMILDKNIFVERVLPGSILRKLTDAEMAVYRRPFASPGEDRRPTLTWPRQIPVAGEPSDVAQVVAGYSAWLGETGTPKLFIDAEPGAIVSDRIRGIIRSWPNLTEAKVKGIHFIQEDSPHEIGEALSNWLGEIGY